MIQDQTSSSASPSKYPDHRLLKAILRSMSNASCWLLAEETPVGIGEKVRFSDLEMGVLGEIKRVSKVEKRWIIFQVQSQNQDQSVELAVPSYLAKMGIIDTLYYYFWYRWLDDTLPPPPQRIPDPTHKVVKRKRGRRDLHHADPLSIAFGTNPLDSQTEDDSLE